MGQEWLPASEPEAKGAQVSSGHEISLVPLARSPKLFVSHEAFWFCLRQLPTLVTPSILDDSRTGSISSSLNWGRESSAHLSGLL